MRTTVTLDESLVNELMRFSMAKTKTSAVTQAVKDQIRKAKLQLLASLLGSIEVDEKAVDEANDTDLERARWLNKLGAENDKKK
jgi:Arc/MetJ family transcription regulator